ncbi:MAG: hypothetical protein H6620_10465 [Halobacteriovoraceae bacterium]|nr:hypothetical protein [Halobacteriovoraceae bacterium]
MKNNSMKTFLNEVCIDLGICLPPQKTKELASRTHYEVNSFVEEIFELEGISPLLQNDLFKQVKKRFANQFGKTFIPK